MRYSIRCCALLLTFAAGSLRADNVDLSTVPNRGGVQLTIYNSEDLTLVRETRSVSFKKGVNPLQFSWAGTLIDPSSVELKFVSHGDQLEVLDTTFPHDKPQMLFWNVQSDFDGEATIEIKYFTSGITWSADYVCISDHDETTMGFEGFVRVYNNSGEQYDDAQIRVVVGTINLVEKIAQLAQVPVNKVAEMDKAEVTKLRLEVASRAMAPMNAPAGAGSGSAAKEIIKEGLSEYFIYTVDGTESIPNGWSKRMRSFAGQTVPFKIQYRYRPEQYGDQLVRMYLLANDKDSKLGTTPLPDGMVRVFRANGHHGLSYLTAQQIKYVPIGDKIELNLGADREVVFELIKRRIAHSDIWVKIEGTDTFKRVDGDKREVDERSSVAGWDDHTLFDQRIRNQTGKPIHVEIRRTFPGHATFKASFDAANHDFQTAQFNVTVRPAQKADMLFELVTRQGRGATQNSLTIEKGEVK